LGPAHPDRMVNLLHDAPVQDLHKLYESRAVILAVRYYTAYCALFDVVGQAYSV